MSKSFVDHDGKLPRVVYAVVRHMDEDPPEVLLGASEESIGHALALDVIAATPPEQLGGYLEEVRDALVERRWAEALVLWMEATNKAVDVYPDEPVLTSAIYEETIELELQFKPIFRDPGT